jgi:ABC-type multidrug transport system fused ATPase/permease subunit
MVLFQSCALVDTEYDQYYSGSVAVNKKLEIDANRLKMMLTLLQGLLVAGGSVLILFTGNIATVGALTAVLIAMRGIMEAASSIGKQAGHIIGYLKKAQALIDFETEYQNKAEPSYPAQPIHPEACAVEAKHLAFAFGEKEVLRDITLRVEKGEHIAIVGENGAGKSTLINLLLGLYPHEHGSIRLFGADPYSVLQSGEAIPAFALFQTFGRYEGLTVEDNVTLGMCAYDKARVGRIDEFLANLDPDTLVGERCLGGRNFSGGEWQKIALARCACVQGVELIVLDEPTAALDPMAEMEIFDNAMELFADQAVILITHRLGAVRKADRIYVIKDGLIFEQGSHAELMARGGFYADMFNEQAGWYCMGEQT